MKSRVLLLTLLCVFVLGVSVQASAADTWITVKSKNFHLVGNASEKQIRQVATKLEQFRETFRQIFPRLKLTQSIATNVVVFKTDYDYRPFKPKDANGKTIDSIAGYFQPGKDVNYITLAIDNDMDGSYGIIFHEYVHFVLENNFGKGEVPAWFNEGLAEYYQTFKIENDQTVTLGIFQQNHLFLLQQNSLMPLKEFFELDNYSLHQSGNHSRSIFYAQAWAVIHYLIQGRSGNGKGLGTFLELVMKGTDPEEAFKTVFLMDYGAMEKALKDYVSQRKYQMSVLTFKNKLVFDTQMTVSPITESEANAYLGDLLYHTNNLADADTYLKKALAVEPNSSFANTSLGLVRMRQRKFDEAKSYLEKAIAGDARNPLAHYNYAYVLSRESMDEFGLVRQYPPATVAKIRSALGKAIELNPEFVENYQLLGFVLMVNNENPDEVIGLLKRANDLNPGNPQSQFLLAQLYFRQEKSAEAKAIAEKLLKSADEAELRSRVEMLLNNIREYDERKAEADKQDKELEDRGFKKPILVKRNGDKPLSDADVERIKLANENITLNKIIKRPGDGQSEVVGYFEKVACVKGEVQYTVRTATGTILLTSKNFSELELSAMIEAAQGVNFGCDADLKTIKAVAIYTPSKTAGAKSKGTLLSITFVPEHFSRLTEAEEREARPTVIVEDAPPDEKRSVDLEAQRRQMIIESIKQRLRKPGAGESRVFGIIEKIECKGSTIFVVKTDDVTLRLPARKPSIISYSQDAAGMSFSCGVTPPPIKAFVIFKGGVLDAGEIVSIEFVPAGITPD